uniref:Uncharacterized protein n=1 Tax=Lepeophtheirus salmonis TaxID=72036 RepID=A0A0K2TPY9_LEPSM
MEKCVCVGKNPSGTVPFLYDMI